jgi:hypothetical protein
MLMCHNTNAQPLAMYFQLINCGGPECICRSENRPASFKTSKPVSQFCRGSSFTHTVYSQKEEKRKLVFAQA